MIAIVNYGSGNIQAIANIYGRLNIPFTIASTPAELVNAERIVLPGVGAFDQAMEELTSSGMREALDQRVVAAGVPLLGICVGMQLLARSSDEGTLPGLGWIDGVVRRFDEAAFRHHTHLPHMGWNTVQPTHDNQLFTHVDLSTGYYFLHSYYFACSDAADVLAVSEYGAPFTCAVQKGHIYGVQFHPEKSHQAGVQLLKNFAVLAQ